jgi:hypothetical protein
VTARRPAIDHRRDGNFVAFGSFASNLVVGDANDNAADVFVQDQTTSTTTLASGATNGGSAPTAMASARFGRPANGSSGAAALSADGRYLAFHTTANKLGVTDADNDFDVYVRAVSMPKIANRSRRAPSRGEARPRSR